MDLSRRSVLAGLAAPALGAKARRAARTFCITPNGSRDGSSWRAAAGLRDLARLIASLRGGGEILLAADQGEYALGEGLDIDAGGARSPIRIRGANRAGAPARATLRGNRGDNVMGDAAFRLRRGADHLHFSNLDFRDVGNGCFHIGGPISDLAVEDCRFENVYRFFENSAQHESQASLNGFAIRRCTGQRVERGFLRVRYESRGGIVEDCSAQGQANQGGAIPAGCALDDRARDIVYRRCVMENFQQWGGRDYWNGDGFSDEHDNANIRYETCVARGSTDGGFDCKSRGVVLTNCTAEANKRNFRIWSDRATLSGCTSRAPIRRGSPLQSGDACHIWIGTAGARIDVSNLTVEDRDATQIFEFDEDGAEVDVTVRAMRTPRENWGHVRVRRNGATAIITPA
jgi:hypothetical protein